jgi:hypothetical protein
VATGLHYSYSSLSLNTGGGIRLKQNLIETGIKIPIQQSFNNFNGPFGAYLGYTRIIETNKWFVPFINLQYEVIMNKKVYINDNSTSKNWLHEAYLSYGMSYKLFKNFSLKNGIGVGGYYERFYDGDEKEFVSQQRPFVKVFLSANYSL